MLFIKTTTRKWRSFFGWSAERRRLFQAAFLLLPLVRVSLWLLGYNRTQSLLTVRHQQESEVDDPARQVWLSEKAIRHARWYLPIDANCLARSLVLKRLLDRQGIDTDLRIGVRQYEGDFEAHAWVEHEGRVVNDSTDIHEQYTAFQGPISLSQMTIR